MARSFAGGTDTIRYGGFNGVTTGAFSLWVKTTSVTANVACFTAWNGSSRTGMGFIFGNTGKMNLQGYDGTTARVNLTSTASVNTGSWLHIGVNFNTANSSTQQIYINGSLDTSGAASAAWSFASTTVTLGDPADAFWASYNGEVAELGMFDRNLSADEMAALAKGFSPVRVAPEPLNFYAPLVRDHHNKTDATVGTFTGTTVSDHPRMMGSLV